jgi:hypothetical protein
VIQLLILIAVIGLCAWLVETYIPMGEPWKTLFRVVAVVIVILFILRMAGISFGGFPSSLR